MTDTRPAAIRQRLYAFLIAGVGGLAASAVSFGMAVYDAAHPPKVAVVSVGQRIDTGRWFVTVLSARVGITPPTGIAPLSPKQYLLVDLDVTNRSATPNNILDRVVTLDEPSLKLPAPMAYLDRDKYFAGYFNPGMPERVTMAWEWPVRAKVPDTVTVAINRQIYKLRDNLYGATGWYDRGAIATVELAVARTP
jgi:hypothetical protein